MLASTAGSSSGGMLAIALYHLLLTAYLCQVAPCCVVSCCGVLR